jgi:hypothetical protein
MSISVSALASLCNSNVVELKFTRRNKMRVPPTRRMLCTLNRQVLDSTLGKSILNFRKPKQAAPYNASRKKLVTVWDIIMQDWRNVPTESVDVVSAINIVPATKFWDFYENVIKPMTSAQKSAFMDK